MASGGARNRSGPQPSESSLTSAKRGLAFRTLDAAGYSGVVPEFPLPASESDDSVSDRERRIWETLWTYPQAIVWAEEPWRQETLAEFCRRAFNGMIIASIGIAPPLVYRSRRQPSSTSFSTNSI